MNFRGLICVSSVLLLWISPSAAFTAGRAAPWAVSRIKNNHNGNVHSSNNDVYIIGDKNLPTRSVSSTPLEEEAGLSSSSSDLSLHEEESSSAADSNNDDSVSPKNNDNDNGFPNEQSLQQASREFQNHSMEAKRPSTAFNNNSLVDSSSIRFHLGALLMMMRPSNIPGVVLFHIVGVYRSLTALGEATTSNLIRTLLRPSMIATLLSVLLITATSMIINDYYDGRSGLDSFKSSPRNNNKYNNVDGRQFRNNNYNFRNPSNHLSDATVIAKQQHHTTTTPQLQSGVPYPVAKRFLSYLYASLLLSISFVPGVSARLSIMIGSMITFWYTQHLKPKTWLKNLSCAILMAQTPLVSGLATMHLRTRSTIAMAKGWVVQIGWGGILRAHGSLTLALFMAFMGREIMMDIIDYEGDKVMGIETVPVRYGRRRASNIVLGFTSATAALTTMGPLVQLLNLNWHSVRSSLTTTTMTSFMNMPSILMQVLAIPSVRRFILASAAGIWMIIRGYQIHQQEGRDDELLNRAMEEAKLQVLLVLGSFI